MHPNFEEEKILWKQGYELVAGLDEAGRGPLAGPVVAAAVIFSAKDGPATGWGKINDSKLLSEKQREELYEILTNHPGIKWGVGVVSEKIIDKINILQATKLAMEKAVLDLGCQADFLLLDGNFKINASRLRKSFGEPKQKSIIKGDQKVFSIAAASIIAKVTRDRIMQKYDKKYPQYGFCSNKGYGTLLHRQNIKQFGLCQIHRKSFCSS